MPTTEVTIERRFLQFDSDTRAIKRGDKWVITGYAAVFNSFSEDLGGFKEIIRPGAFARALKEGQDVRGLINHEPDNILGRTSAGTMRLKEDRKGLFYEIDIPDTQAGRDIVVSIERRDITGSSFSFMIVAGGDSWRDENGEMIREVYNVDLFDVGPVTFPAYKNTVSDAAKRSLEQARANPPKRFPCREALKADIARFEAIINQ